jgi:hypothetical protein
LMKQDIAPSHPGDRQIEPRSDKDKSGRATTGK